MNTESIRDALQLDGYGLYVWGSYGAALLLLGLESWLARRRHARALNESQLEDQP